MILGRPIQKLLHPSAAFVPRGVCSIDKAGLFVVIHAGINRDTDCGTYAYLAMYFFPLREVSREWSELTS